MRKSSSTRAATSSFFDFWGVSGAWSPFCPFELVMAARPRRRSPALSLLHARQRRARPAGQQLQRLPPVAGLPLAPAGGRLPCGEVEHAQHGAVGLAVEPQDL